VVSCERPSPGPSHLDSFRLTGPAEIAPGSTASFNAILDKVTTLKDVSEQSEWTSSNPSALSVAAGLAAAHLAGETLVTARLDGQETDPAVVIVVPAGTYRLRGTVTLLTNTATVIPFARVEVPAVGLATTADALGRFVFYGVPPNAELHATRDGYAPAVTTVHLFDHLGVARVTMRPMLEGTFTLSIRPAGTCREVPPVPADLLQRTYTVALAPPSPNASLISGTFPGASNITVVQFTGSATPQGNWNITFVIGEQLPDGKVLRVNGSATVRASDLVGTFSGGFAVYDPSTGEPPSRCTALGFPFVLTR